MKALMPCLFRPEFHQSCWQDSSNCIYLTVSNSSMRNIVIAVLTLTSVFAYSQPTSLSDSAEISILTLGPSQEQLYSAFGHSAMRVYDPQQNFDYVFNWGVFDFD